MSVTKKNKKNLIVAAIVYLQIFSYLVLANAFTINLGERFPVKISELFSIITFLSVIMCLLFYRQKNFFVIKKRYLLLYIWILYVIILDIACIFINKYSLSDSFYGFFYLLRIIHLILLIKALHFLIEKENISKYKLLKFVKACYIIVVLIGLIQLLVYPVAFDWYDVFYKLGFYWANPDPHHDRMLSTYFDPNYLASCLIIPIAICLSQLLSIRGKNKKNNSEKIKLLFELTFFIIAILLTKSRSGIVGLAISFLVVFFLFGMKRKTSIITFSLIGIMMIVFVFMFFFSNISVFVRIRNFATDPSAMHRFDSWKASFEYFKDSNFIGIGYNMLGAYKNIIGEEVGRAASYGMDSSILFVLVTTGLIGFILFIALLYKVISRKDKHYINNSVKIIIISSVFVSFFNNLLFYIIWMFPVMFIDSILNCQDKKMVVLSKKEGDLSESIANK